MLLLNIIDRMKTADEQTDVNKSNLKILKKAMTQELQIPPAIYSALFNWILFSAHALVTAEMFSHTRLVS